MQNMEPDADVKWVNPVFDSSTPKLPYGHGFGPPESALDLSISGPSRAGEDVEKDLRLTFRIKAEMPSDASDADSEREDRPGEEEEEGCSRTLPRLPKRLQLKFEAQVKEEEAKETPRKENASSKKVPPPVGIAVARQRTHEKESRPATPPVKAQPLSTPLTPQATSLGSTMGVSYSHPMSNVFFPPSAWPWPEPPLMQPAPAFPWHPVNDVLAVPGHPGRPFLGNLEQVNVTPAGISPYLLIPAAFLDPYQRAAAAVLWPGYAAAAAAAAATTPQGWSLQPEASPHLPPLFPQTPFRYSASVPDLTLPAPAPLLEELHRQKQSLSSSNPHEMKLERADGKHESVSLKSAVNRKKSAPALSMDTAEALISPLSVHVDPISVTPVSLSNPGHDLPDSGGSDAATKDKDEVQSTIVKVEPSPTPAVDTVEMETPMEVSVAVADEDAGKLNVELPAAVPDTPAVACSDDDEGQPKPPEEAASFAGLQLLSESIERFVSAAAQEPPIAGSVTDEAKKSPARDVALGGATSHPLDVLFAAALAAEPAQGTCSASVDSGLTLEHCRTPANEACVEEDVRKKLTQLQQQYKERQKELKHLKVKKKEKKKKKEKNKEKKKDGEVSARVSTRPTSADYITPGKLQHALANTTQATGGGGEAVLPSIKTSYAAALASAASSQSTDLFSVPTSAAKKRKPDLPRKHDSECTETIVPKKRKLFQLLQWCRPECQWNSEAPGESFGVKPKVKPSLKAEVKVKQAESELFSSESEEEQDRLELHCLPALQYLQLCDEADPMDSSYSTVLPDAEPQAEVQSGRQAALVPPNEEKTELPSCALRQDLLEDGRRVLIAEDGLFQGGCVRNIRPPDIYGVAVDGERGSRPRILSTEEILHGTILEVKVASVSQLKPGTRICAYWSQHSRCLYPGTVNAIIPAGTTQSGKHALIEDQVDVEFDDGDTGRIPLSQIRFLPQDYPIIERDPNPVLPIESRRKRRGSGVAAVPISSAPVAVAVPVPAALEEGSQSPEPHSKKAKKKKHKKKHKKKSKYDDDEKPTTDSSLVIPVSPGPVAGIVTEPEAFNESGYHSMEVGEEGSTVTLAPPPPRRAAAAALAKSKEQQQQQHQPQQLSPSGKSKSKMAAFLPERQLWKWLGPSFKKASKGKGRKEFYKAIHRGKEIIRVGDCAVFLSSGRPDRPYVGRIELLWQSWGGSMTVKVRWFYHPEETCGGRRLSQLKTPGALFESNHVDENDVQTISHSCLVLPLHEFRERRKPDENLNLDGCYDLFYLAGFYDPTSAHLSFEPGVFEPAP